MGEQGDGPPLAPEKMAAARARLEELEALGVPTAALKVTLETRPQDFEREADEAMAREMQGGGDEPIATEPLGEGAPQEVRISGGGEPLVAPTVAPKEAPGQAIAPTPEAPSSPNAPPAVLETDEMNELVEALKEVMRALPDASPPGPEPSLLESPAPEGAAFEAELAQELDQALEEGPSDGSAPPPLADGGSLSMGAAEAAAPLDAAAKPAPPTGRVAPVKVQKVKVVRSGAPPPQGARAEASGAGAASVEVLPTAVAPHRRYAAPAAVVLVALLFLGTYLLLVNGAPNAVFSIDPTFPAAGEEVVFSANNTTDPNGDPITFHWDFGDGTNATGQVARHTYAKSGNYTVVLTATDNQKNSAKAPPQTVRVTPGYITPPVYSYGDTLGYLVAGTSHVEGVGAPLATVNFSFGGAERSCNIDAVDLNYTGPRTRTVKDAPETVQDGFLDNHDTYVLERHLQQVPLFGQISSTCPTDPFYSGTADIDEKDFVNPNNNDTVRSETFEDASVTVQADVPKNYASSAHLTDFPELANASDQLHLEKVYAGVTFSTEDFASGQFTAEGLTWSWVTRGPEVVSGILSIKIHLVATNLPPQYVGELYTDLWVSSASSFPLREVYYVRGYDVGKTYTSNFEATATGPGVPGTAAISFTATPRAYRTVAPAELSPMTQVPRASVTSDFAFTPRTAFDEGVSRCGDFANFTVDNPQAYSVNGTYSLATGNPRWMLEFAQDKSGERMRVEDEHSTSTQVRCSPGSQGAARPLSQIGQVVSLNYAADLLRDEQSANALFPLGPFDAAHANFTVKQELKLPSVSFNAATAASRAAVPLAFGGESFPSETTRTSAYVDAKSGQIVFVLTESGDKLP
jgi:PKD repeat protein